MSRAVLFDIDGTIARYDGAGRVALGSAMQTVFGISAERADSVLGAIDFRGITDTLVAEEIGRQLEVDVCPRHDLFEAYASSLSRHFLSHTVDLLPGVEPLVAALEQAGVHVGLLTGNSRAGARIKLRHVGLERLADRAGACGDEARERVSVAALASERLSAIGLAADRTFVIGDTEHDVRAARAIGAAAVVVCTGWTDRAVLAASAPDLLMDDLSQPADLLGLIGLSG